jgi:4-amino-4-deoxy-L-arabinose transferase-like glycosyltransferase
LGFNKEILKCKVDKYKAIVENLHLELKNFRALLSAHYQLIGIVIAAFIVLQSMGTYTNWDAQTEFEAASSVVTRGFPYVTIGLMIDQPPFAFYMTAPIMLLFGLSYTNGVVFVSALGLGCVAIVYALGTLLYGKKTGLVAAALFGMVPWQVFMARTYLIDVQYMFLGLLFLLAGIYAVKRKSEKLLAVSGILFALAFLTKLFTIFLLLPLLLTVLFKGKENGFKLSIRKILIFLIPSLIFQAIWFGGLANQHFFGVYVASDFTHPDLIANPSWAFLPRIFIESAGWFLPAATVFSLILAISFKRLLAKTSWVDTVFAITILAVIGVDLSLVFGKQLLVPYVSAFKYNYATLPFICLLAASILHKGEMLFGSTGKRKIKLFLTAFGVILLFASLLESLLFLNHTQPYPLIDFKVDYIGHYFPFYILTPVGSNFQEWHYVALAIILLTFATPFIMNSLKKSINRISIILSH